MQEIELSIAKLIELAQTLDKAKEDLKTRINELEAENTELKAGRSKDGASMGENMSGKIFPHIQNHRPT